MSSKFFSLHSVSDSFRDAIILMLFASFSLLYFIGVWDSIQPLGLVTGDAGNIASFTAARIHPEAFTRDFALSNIKHFQFYATIHIPLLVLLHKLFNFHLGKAFIVLLPFQTFFQLAGFYILGRVLFRNRIWALL